MKYHVHARLAMGDLTFFVDADNEEEAQRRAMNCAFADTMKLAKKVTVYPVGDEANGPSNVRSEEGK